ARRFGAAPCLIGKTLPALEEFARPPPDVGVIGDMRPHRAAPGHQLAAVEREATVGQGGLEAGDEVGLGYCRLRGITCPFAVSSHISYCSLALVSWTR